MTDMCDLGPDHPRDCPTCGMARVRAAMSTAPRPAATQTPLDPDPTRARALARARHERTQP